MSSSSQDRASYPSFVEGKDRVHRLPMVTNTSSAQHSSHSSSSSATAGGAASDILLPVPTSPLNAVVGGQRAATSFDGSPLCDGGGPRLPRSAHGDGDNMSNVTEQQQQQPYHHLTALNRSARQHQRRQLRRRSRHHQQRGNSAASSTTTGSDALSSGKNSILSLVDGGTSPPLISCSPLSSGVSPAAFAVQSEKGPPSCPPTITPMAHSSSLRLQQPDQLQSNDTAKQMGPLASLPSEEAVSTGAKHPDVAAHKNRGPLVGVSFDPPPPPSLPLPPPSSIEVAWLMANQTAASGSLTPIEVATSPASSSGDEDGDGKA